MTEHENRRANAPAHGRPEVGQEPDTRLARYCFYGVFGLVMACIVGLGFFRSWQGEQMRAMEARDKAAQAHATAVVARPAAAGAEASERP